MRNTAVAQRDIGGVRFPDTSVCFLLVGDSQLVNALRATAYVLTSLASLLFITLVIYGYVQLNAFAERLQSVLPGVGTSSSAPAFSEPAPPADATGEEMYCFYNPEDPMCAS